MPSAQQRDKISGLVLVAAMVAIAAGLRAWPHRFPDSRQLRLSKTSAPVLAVHEPPSAPAPAIAVSTVAVPVRTPGSRHAAVAKTDIQTQPSAPVVPRRLSSSAEPLTSRPLLLPVAIVGVPSMPASKAAPGRETNAANMGASLARAFSRAGHKTAHAFTRAF